VTSYNTNLHNPYPSEKRAREGARNMLQARLITSLSRID
jgi:hypothetical protein